MMVMMMGRSHGGTHRVVPVLMVRRAPSMRMVLGGMMLMRMIGGRQEARRRRINTRTVTGRPAERCCEQINEKLRVTLISFHKSFFLISLH